MSLRTFIRGLVSGTKSSGPKESTSIDSEDSSSESGNPSKAHSPESNDGPYRAARDVVYDFLPMFRKLNEQGTDYCVVGGMAVLLQAMDKARDSNRFRATHDADIMFGSEYTNVVLPKYIWLRSARMGNSPRQPMTRCLAKVRSKSWQKKTRRWSTVPSAVPILSRERMTIPTSTL